MKKRSSLRPIFLLAALSAAIYLTQILLFRDVKDTAFYLLQDFAFLPVQVALVTVIAGRIISDREKESRVEKTRMLTGSFFSGAGAAGAAPHHRLWAGASGAAEGAAAGGKNAASGDLLQSGAAGA